MVAQRDAIELTEFKCAISLRADHRSSAAIADAPGLLFSLAVVAGAGSDVAENASTLTFRFEVEG